jgi:thiamine biosynthesis lipoprotein
MKPTHAMDRRAFLKLAGSAGLAASLPLVSPAIGLASLNRQLKVAQMSRMMMGTIVAVTVVDTSPGRAQEAMSLAFQRMEELTPIFDRHHGNGPLRALNQEGRVRDLSPDFKRVLGLCRQVHQLSGGAFDITVAPIVDTYRKSFAAGHKPSAKEIQAALAAVGGLRIEADGLLLTREGAGVTLDGVAKGFIADQGLKAIRQAGATNALINAGGDVAVMGDAGGRPWRIAVADPDHPTQAKTKVEMTSGALATSGNYEVYFDRDKLFHHIVNPATGRSPRTDTSSSVRAPQAVLADAMSTACFVLPPFQAMRLLKAQNLQGLIYTRNHQRYATEGFWG